MADVAVHVQVLKGVLGEGAPQAGLAVLGHGVTVRDLHFGGINVSIASGDLHHGMARVRASAFCWLYWMCRPTCWVSTLRQVCGNKSWNSPTSQVLSRDHISGTQI